jgi:hypothetical protein
VILTYKDSASSLYELSRRIADEYIKLNNNKIKQVSDIKDEQTLFIYDNFKFENELNNSVKVFLNNIHVGNRLSEFYINGFKNYIQSGPVILLEMGLFMLLVLGGYFYLRLRGAFKWD